MFRALAICVFLSLLALPLLASTPCNLTIAMNCTGGTCSTVTTNSGTNMCSGEFIIAILIDDDQGRGTVTMFRNSLGLTECFDSSTLPIGFGFGACIGIASLGPGNSFTTSGQINLSGAPASEIVAFTGVNDPLTGEDLGFTYVFNNVAPTPTCTPTAAAPPVAQSGASYDLTWFEVTEPNATYIVDQSTTSDFTSNVMTQTTAGVPTTCTPFGSNATNCRKLSFQNNPGKYHYRVRANACSGAPGPFSPTVATVVQDVPTVPATSPQGDAVTSNGSTTPVVIKVDVKPPASGKQAFDVPFTASTDKPFLTVSPSSGTIPPGGTTLTVTLNPTGLPPGANTGTLTVNSGGSTIASKSLSVSLVNPVAPGGKTLPPPNTLIIPAVAHAPGALGPFQSDVRLTNGSPSVTTYQVTFTPTRTNATQTSKTTSVSVDPAQTIALNDILKDFFGVGATGSPSDQGQGTLEIRPVNSSSILNYAASRTFTFNEKGTFGQFIAAIPFSAFATKASLVPIPGAPPPATPVLSLQQVAQSAKFRSNYGLVEGSGSPASGTVNVYDDRGTLVKSVPYSLQPGEHQQASLASIGVDNLDDGRIEVTVESPTGAVTAYVSVLDNKTNDPLAVTPVQVSQISATRYVLPGMAAIGGPNNFHSDIRIFNGGSNPATVNATFYPQGNGTPVTIDPFSIEPRGVRAFDDVVVTKFNANGLGGSIVLTTATPSSLVATGRTYTIDENNGTFGQFIPGVMPSQGIGAGDRPLQILQLEQSPNFRSNLGLTELTGNPATVTQCGGLLQNPVTACVHVTAYVPDSKVTAAVDVPLSGNQFLQLNRVLASIYPGQNIYNARISVEVTGGTGRVSAYGSFIDNSSRDPMFIPPQ